MLLFLKQLNQIVRNLKEIICCLILETLRNMISSKLIKNNHAVHLNIENPVCVLECPSPKLTPC